MVYTVSNFFLKHYSIRLSFFRLHVLIWWHSELAWRVIDANVPDTVPLSPKELVKRLGGTATSISATLTTPTSPGWPVQPDISRANYRGEPQWNRRSSFSANYHCDLFKTFRPPVRSSVHLMKSQLFAVSAASGCPPAWLLPSLPPWKIRSMNPQLISSSRSGESSGNYRCHPREGEAGWGEMRWDVPLWQPSAEYWLGVITVTVERTPTNLTFNNETLVRVTSAWWYTWGAKCQSEKREKEREIRR